MRTTVGLRSRKMRCLVMFLLLALPAFSAITRTARGTNAEKVRDRSFTCPSAEFTPAATDLIIFVVVHDNTSAFAVVPTWSGSGGYFSANNGLPITEGGINVSAWRRTGEATLGHAVMTFSGDVRAKACFMVTISGTLGVPALDVVANPSAFGSTTGVASGSIMCAPAPGGDCFWLAALGVEGPSDDAAPTWTNPDNAGQRAGTSAGGATTNVTINEGFEIVPNGVAQAVSAMLGTARDWLMQFVTYRDAAAAAIRESATRK
jgi:hypothetical protein